MKYVRSIVRRVAANLREMEALGQNEKFRRQRGELSVIDILIFVVIAVAVLPTAIAQIIAVDTSAWPDAAETLWDLSPVLIVIGVALFLVKRFTGGGSQAGI